MNFLMSVPIRKKIRFVIISTTFLTVVLIFAGFFAYEYYNRRSATVYDLTTKADIIAENSNAALAFRDSSDAARVLNSLISQQNIVSAAIYDKNKNLFATYIRAGQKVSFPDRPESESWRFGDNELVMYKPIKLNENEIGTLYINMDLEVQRQLFYSYLKIAFLVLAGSLIIAYIVAYILAKNISSPIVHLVDTIKKISRKGDYSIRAEKSADDETGILADSFNNMLKEIHENEKRLNEAKELLESRVMERTAELQKSNLMLKEEINERLKAEATVKTERQRFYDVLETLPAYLVLLSPDYHVIFENRYFRERFGESQGRKCYEYLFGRNEPCETCETYKVLETNSKQHWEWLGPDNHNYDVYDFPFKDTDGNSLILEMGIDVTEQKKAEAALRVAGAYNRSLIEASLDPLVTINPEGRITDVNTATENVTGYSRYELIGKNFSYYFTEPQKAELGYQKVLSDGEVIDYPLTINHKDGRLTDVLYNATVYRNESGEIQGVFAAARDITQRKRIEEELDNYRNHLEKLVKERTIQLENSNKKLQVEIAERKLVEEALRKSEEQLQIITDSLPVLISYIDKNQRYLFSNKQYELWFGVKREEMKGIHIKDVLGDTIYENVHQHVERVLTGEHVRFESWINFKLAGLKYIDAEFIPSVDEKGNILGFYVLSVDMTERKLSEEALQLSEWRYRTLIETAPEIIYTLYSDGAIRSLNPSFQKITGWAIEEWLGKPFTYLLHPDDTLIAEKNFQLSLQSELVPPFEMRILARSGEYIFGEFTPIPSAEKDIVWGIARDISLRKQQQQKLELALMELQRSNHDLEQFAYTASHDLQEPIRMVKSFAQLIERKYSNNLDKDLQEYLGFISEGASRMQQLVSDLLKYSRITTGKQFDKVDCDEVLRQVLDDLTLTITEQDVKIRYDKLPVVMGDTTQLRQLFQNLIQNAIKFRSERQPEIVIKCELNEDKWLFSVSDNGIGIKNEHFDKIFIIFQRLHERGKYPGTGLGLAICKRIVERHGGDIYLYSEPGKCTTFYFTIPV